MKKGFTIAEMLGVVIILCIIAIIAFPPILNLVKKTEKELDEATEQLLYTSASQYITKYNNDYPRIENATYCVSIKLLLEENLISNNTVENNELSMNNGVIVKVKDHKYEYEFTKLCKNNKSYVVGDIVKLNTGNDMTSEWYVIEDSNSNESTIKLLKSNNIDNNFYVFDEENHRTTENNSYCTVPQNGCNIYASNGTTVTEDSSIKIKVDEYGTTLGLGNNLEEIRLITKDELVKLGCSAIENTCSTSSYSWVYSQRYWTMSEYENSTDDSWFVYYGDWFDAESPTNEHGIRPVIIVSKDIIN